MSGPQISNEARIANSLEGIQKHLEVMSAVALEEHTSRGGAVTESSLFRQLGGSTAGFADELDSILNESDMFKRVQGLRDLQKRARKIADGYIEKALEAESFETPEPAKDEDENPNSG